jgi:superfamily II DNA or RNA helicase
MENNALKPVPAKYTTAFGQDQLYAGPYHQVKVPPPGIFELRDVQMEGALSFQHAVELGDTWWGAEVAPSAGKTAMAALISVPYVGGDNSVLFITGSTRRTISHFEDEFIKVYDHFGIKNPGALIYTREQTTGTAPVAPGYPVQILRYYDIVTHTHPEAILSQAKLIIVDEAHRLPDDYQQDTKQIGALHDLIREYAPQAHVVAMTGTFWRMDKKLPMGIEETHFQVPLERLIHEDVLPPLYSLYVPMMYKVKGKVTRDTTSGILRYKLSKKCVRKYRKGVCDNIVELIRREKEFIGEDGQQGGHIVFVATIEEAKELTEQVNRALGAKKFSTYTSDDSPDAERIEAAVRSGKLLGIVTVHMGGESLSINRLKYCHLVARMSSTVKLFQAVCRVTRAWTDENNKDLKDKAVVIDYQLMDAKILRLATGLREIKALAGSAGPVRLNGPLVGKAPEGDLDAIWLDDVETALVPRILSDVELNKQALLGMDERPSRTTKLGRALNSYTNRNSSYDEEFDTKIRALKPHWFIDVAQQKQEVTDRKKQLLAMDERPSRTTKLGRALGDYTRRNGSSYDEEFDTKIRALKPHWFIDVETRTQDIAERKQQLLEMEERPSKKTRLGQALAGYTTRSNTSYDEEFDVKIRALRPHWFSASRKAANQQQLLEMEERPHPTTTLGRALNGYTARSGGSYDEEFDKKIRALKPHWFLDSRKATNQQQLLEMADRPTQKTKLGRALKGYTRRNDRSYDEEFDTKIRALKPHWFKVQRV